MSPEPESAVDERHRVPRNFGDRFANAFVRALRFFADLFFANRYGHRAIVLETVAAVPGMVGATLTHLRCLRRAEADRGCRIIVPRPQVIQPPRRLRVRLLPVNRNSFPTVTSEYGWKCMESARLGPARWLNRNSHRMYSSSRSWSTSTRCRLTCSNVVILWWSWTRIVFAVIFQFMPNDFRETTSPRAARNPAARRNLCRSGQIVPAASEPQEDDPT